MTFLKILFENSDNKTILKNLKQELMSVIKLNFNYASYILNFVKIMEKEMERQTLNINTAI